MSLTWSHETGPADTGSPNDSMTLKAEGASRFAGAAFLGVWLCGWAAGECAALLGIAMSVGSMLGLPPPPGFHMGGVPSGPGVWLMLAFLLVWLAFWTLGGVAALTTFLRMLAGVDVVSWNATGVDVRRGPSFGRWRERIAFTEVWSFEPGPNGAIVAAGPKGRREVTALGSRAQREALLQRIRGLQAERGLFPVRDLARGSEDPAPPRLPAHWYEAPDDTGRLALHEPRRAKAFIGATMGLFVLGAVAGMFAIESKASRNGWSVPTTIAMAVLALLVPALGTYVARLVGTRRVLRAHDQTIEEVEDLFGRMSTRRWSPATLSLEQSRDSDGDEAYSLVVGGPGGERRELLPPRSRPEDALAVGRWLARHAGIPLGRGERAPRRPTP